MNTIDLLVNPRSYILHFYIFIYIIFYFFFLIDVSYKSDLQRFTTPQKYDKKENMKILYC